MFLVFFYRSHQIRLSDARLARVDQADSRIRDFCRHDRLVTLAVEEFNTGKLLITGAQAILLGCGPCQSLTWPLVRLTELGTMEIDFYNLTIIEPLATADPVMPRALQHLIFRCILLLSQCIDTGAGLDRE